MMRYFEDCDGFDDDLESRTVKESGQRLVDGIDLRDLIDGKDVIFQINEDYTEGEHQTDFKDDFQDVTEVNDLEKLRKSRGAPDPNTTFESIAASMISLDENGYVKKEVISQGIGASPPEHSRVIVHYNFYKEHNDEPFDSTYLRGRPCKLNLGVGEVIPGLELAIKSMRKNENSRFLIKWQVAFGHQGCPPRIGKECDILADVTLVNYSDLVAFEDDRALTERDRKPLNFDQTLKAAKNFHCLGNSEFSSGDIKAAIKSYRKCVNMLNGVKIANEDEEREMLSLKVKCLVNIAICCNKCGRSEQACTACQDALSIEPNNVKAVYQYGKANLILNNIESAEKWLKKAKHLKFDDENINRELEKLWQKKKSAHLQDTLFWQRAFGKPSEVEAEKSKKQ